MEGAMVSIRKWGSGKRRAFKEKGEMLGNKVWKGQKFSTKRVCFPPFLGSFSTGKQQNRREVGGREKD